jgi:hypothetical protein
LRDADPPDLVIDLSNADGVSRIGSSGNTVVRDRLAVVHRIILSPSAWDGDSALH